MSAYSIDYEKMKSEALENGFDLDDWAKWEYSSTNTIRKAGFLTPEDVRRAADKNGRRIG